VVSDPWVGCRNLKSQGAVKLLIADLLRRLPEPHNGAGSIDSATTAVESLAFGSLGLALTCSHLDRCYPDDGWDLRAHGYVQAALRTPVAVLPPGLFNGLAGVAFTVYQLSCEGARYQTLLRNIETTLLESTYVLCQRASAISNGCDVGAFDVISGVAGIGLYLLCRLPHPEFADAAERVAHSLSLLTLRKSALPAWHTPFADLPPTAKLSYRSGNLNCGLAHGAPGILAFLALAYTAGIRSKRHEEAITNLAEWLCEIQLTDTWGPNWPYAISLDGTPPIPSRVAWCYGIPGVARSLWLAGQALDQSDWRSTACNAIEVIARRLERSRDLTSATFCHGTAGVLQVALRFANDCGVGLDLADALLEVLLSQYEPDSLFGYSDVDEHGRRIENESLLGGMSGVLLTLVSATEGYEPHWDRVFALS
jgi:hypothetical protein